MTPIPDSSSRRLLAPDLSRGVMLLLIAMAYAGVYVASGFAVDVSSLPLIDRVSAFATTLFLDNRAFPLFAILFGYGLARSVSRRRARGVDNRSIRRRNRRRAGFLILFGFVHAFLVYPGEILASYGLALLLLGWLLLRSQRVLVITTAVFAGMYLLTVTLLQVLAAVFTEAVDTGLEPQVAVIPGYTTLEDWIGRLVGLPISPLYIAVAYPLLLLVAIGFLAGRARLLDDPAARRTQLLTIAAIGITVSVAGAFPSALIAVGAIDPAAATAGLLHGLQILTGVLGGAGYAALFALIATGLEHRRGPVTDAVAAVGKRSLTFYVGNSALVALVLHRDLLGLGTLVGPFGALVTATLVWALGVAVAAWLEHKDRPGPLEQLMRRLVDMERPAAQPVR